MERSLFQSSGFRKIATPDMVATSYKHTSASPATSYYYRVRTVNNDANFNYSNTVNPITPAAASVPAAPGGLTATAWSSSEINLSWTDDSNNETGFKIGRGQLQSAGFSQIGTTSADTTDKRGQSPLRGPYGRPRRA